MLGYGDTLIGGEWGFRFAHDIDAGQAFIGRTHPAGCT